MRRYQISMNSMISCSLCLLLLFSWVMTLNAQSATASLSGTAVDATNAVVPSANVTVLNTATGLRRESTTNSSGFFTYPLLPPGTYVLTVVHPGFSPVEVNDLVLNVGDVRSIKIQLKVASVGESITVKEEANLITESAAVSTVVDRQFVENMPLNGRSFQSLITLTPGVVLTVSTVSPNPGQFSVNGQRASANSFIVDGVSANFGSNGGLGTQTAGNLPTLTTFGTTQSLVSVDALQEFKVQTSTYSAEYGRQPGGQISMVTRSGTNQFHGSAFDYLRNDLFDANDWFADRAGQRKPAERQNDFGGTLGGPMLIPGFYDGHNQTFFFFSYEGLRLRLPQFVLTNVPTLCLRGQGSCPSGQTAASAGLKPILSTFPLPNGRDLGNGFAEFSSPYSDPSSLDATSIRIDHTISRKLSLFGRYSKAPSETLSRYGGNLSTVQFTRLGTQTITVGLTASPTSSTSNDLRVNYSGNRSEAGFNQDTFGGATLPARNVLIPSQFDSSTAQGSVFFVIPGTTSAINPGVDLTGTFLTSQYQFNVVNNFSYSKGSHQFRFGVDYRRMMPVFSANSYLFSGTFSTQQQVINAIAGSGSVAVNAKVNPIYVNFSVYGEDTWKLSHRLTANVGLRWDVNPAPGEANGNDPFSVTEIDNLASMQLGQRGAPLWKTTYNNFAPRLGMAYQLREHPDWESVVRGGFGIFYDTGNDQSAREFNGGFPYVGRIALSNISFPLLPSQVAPPSFPGLTPPVGNFFAFDPNQRLPYTLEWNLAVEQALGKNQAATLSYVGAAGRRLLQDTQLTLNPINPSFTTVFITRNTARSNYDALQAKFQRRLSGGLQALVSYTWSHALDDDSSSFTLRVPRYGNSTFDVRHVFAAAATYDIPAPISSTVAHAILGGWSVDTNFHAQSGLPVDLVATTLTNPADGSLVNVRPNVNSGVPLYADDPIFGRRINPAAFNTNIPAGQSGNFGRNQVRGLGAWQIDTAVRREFPIHENLKLQFRAEAFNLFNHPNFGAIQTTLTSPNFGQPTNMLNRQLGGISQLYQIGGPRSFQFALKLLF